MALNILMLGPASETSEKGIKQGYKGLKMTYLQIDGMMTPDEACQALELNISRLTSAIQRNDNVFFENRVTSANALIHLLRQYAEQEDRQQNKLKMY